MSHSWESGSFLVLTAWLWQQSRLSQWHQPLMAHSGWRRLDCPAVCVPVPADPLLTTWASLGWGPQFESPVSKHRTAQEPRLGHCFSVTTACQHKNLAWCYKLWLCRNICQPHWCHFCLYYKDYLCFSIAWASSSDTQIYFPVHHSKTGSVYKQ